MKFFKNLFPEPQGATTQNHIPQYSLKMILFMFTWPCVWFAFLIYFIGPLFIKNTQAPLPTWLHFAVWTLGNGAELAVALLILRREGYRLTWSSLKDRLSLTWPKRSWKTWAIVIIVLVAAYIVAVSISDLNTVIAKLAPPPDWMPDHPLKPSPNSIQEGYTDVSFPGNYGFILLRYVFLGFILNMIGEELYYRGVLMPKMRAVFGKWDWFANGVGFTLKHLYFYWRLPIVLPAALAFAVIFKAGGLPLAVLAHWIGNFEIVELIEAIKAVFGN